MVDRSSFNFFAFVVAVFSLFSNAYAVVEEKVKCIWVRRSRKKPPKVNGT